MSKAVAIAAVQDHPFILAAESAGNLMKLLANLMYGTEERTKMTCALAFALALFGASLQSSAVHALQVCAL